MYVTWFLLTFFFFFFKDPPGSAVFVWCYIPSDCLTFEHDCVLPGVWTCVLPDVWTCVHCLTLNLSEVSSDVVGIRFVWCEVGSSIRAVCGIFISPLDCLEFHQSAFVPSVSVGSQYFACLLFVSLGFRHYACLLFSLAWLWYFCLGGQLFYLYYWLHHFQADNCSVCIIGFIIFRLPTVLSVLLASSFSGWQLFYLYYWLHHFQADNCSICITGFIIFRLTTVLSVLLASSFSGWQLLCLYYWLHHFQADNCSICIIGFIIFRLPSVLSVLLASSFSGCQVFCLYYWLHHFQADNCSICIIGFIIFRLPSVLSVLLTSSFSLSNPLSIWFVMLLLLAICLSVVSFVLFCFQQSSCQSLSFGFLTVRFSSVPSVILCF